MLRELFHDHPVAASVAALILAPLLAWRIWSFTIRPWIWSSAPKVLPYWVPFIGHTFDFFWNYTELLERGLSFTRQPHAPFAIQLMGQKLYVITDPASVTALFDNTVPGLEFDSQLSNLFSAFGVTPEALRRAFHVPGPGQKDMVHAAEDIYKKQLLPGPHMDEMSQAFMDSVSDSLRPGCPVSPLGALRPGQGHRGGGRGGGGSRMSLYRLVRTVMVEATARSMYGDHLHRIDPRVVEYSLAFNDHAWMVVFRYPDWAGSPAAEPRRKLMDIMMRFVQLPADQRAGASWSIRNVLAGMEEAGIDVKSRAAFMLMIFWASVSNESNACFWLLAHLLHDPSLLSLVHRETESAFDPTTHTLDVKRLSTSSPHLEAVFLEVLRHKNAASAVRAVSSPSSSTCPSSSPSPKSVTLNGHALTPGSLVTVPFRLLHSNPLIWGADAADFRPGRFLKEPGLARSPAFRPFGGGRTYCPGRNLARQMIFGFVAVLLRRFDVRLASVGTDDGGDGGDEGGRQKFPALNTRTPSVGMNGPVKGEDVWVEVIERGGGLGL